MSENLFNQFSKNHKKLELPRKREIVTWSEIVVGADSGPITDKSAR